MIMLLDVFTDEGHVGWRNSATWNKVLGPGHGWLEAAAEHSAAQVVPASNWQRCYEWIRPGCSHTEHAYQDLWILPKQVTCRTWYFSNSLITFVLLCFLLHFSFDWEHLSNTQFLTTFQTPLKVHQKYSAACRIFNSFLGVWKCVETLSFVFYTVYYVKYEKQSFISFHRRVVDFVLSKFEVFGIVIKCCLYHWTVLKINQEGVLLLSESTGVFFLS